MRTDRGAAERRVLDLLPRTGAAGTCAYAKPILRTPPKRGSQPIEEVRVSVLPAQRVSADKCNSGCFFAHLG